MQTTKKVFPSLLVSGILGNFSRNRADCSYRITRQAAITMSVKGKKIITILWTAYGPSNMRNRTVWRAQSAPSKRQTQLTLDYGQSRFRLLRYA